MSTGTPRARRRGVRAPGVLLAALVALASLLAACGSPATAEPTAAPAPAAAPTAAPASAPNPAPAAPGNPSRQAIDLTILHTNDVMGEIDPCG